MQTLPELFQFGKWKENDYETEIHRERPQSFKKQDRKIIIYFSIGNKLNIKLMANALNVYIDFYLYL